MSIGPQNAVAFDQYGNATPGARIGNMPFAVTRGRNLVTAFDIQPAPRYRFSRATVDGLADAMSADTTGAFGLTRLGLSAAGILTSGIRPRFRGQPDKQGHGINTAHPPLADVGPAGPHHRVDLGLATI